MSRKVNFYAGPSVLPVDVLQIIQEEMVDFHSTGLSLVEMSHRNQIYEEIHNQAISLLKELMSIPESFNILFLGGGATLQFSMVPLNFLNLATPCDFTLTGTWARKAYSDAIKIGDVNIIYDGKSNGYTSLPGVDELQINANASYLHMTSNETIDGVQWKDWPEAGDIPIICDMSSDILSRPIPFEKFGLIYAGAQKNLGPSGVTIVIIHEDMLTRCPDSLPAYLSYRTHANKNSMYNTPPVFPIYAMKLVLERMRSNGGLAVMEEHNRQKAELLYSTIDESDGFYRCPADPRYRSDMNVVFKLPNEELEREFIKKAAGSKMVGLKGHRDVGGCRASIYNSMTLEGVSQLTDFMKDYASSHRPKR